MEEKGMIQILIPFISAAIIVIIFYVVGFIIGFIGDGLLNIRECGEIESFLFIFSGDYPIGSSIFAGICWVFLTAFLEMISTDL